MSLLSDMVVSATSRLYTVILQKKHPVSRNILLMREVRRKWSRLIERKWQLKNPLFAIMVSRQASQSIHHIEL